MGPRPLPELTPYNRPFWTGGREGKLVFLRCTACHTFVHPPTPVCPSCLKRELVPEAVSGRAVVVACTLNCKAWTPGDEVPYSIAIVEMPEQKGLRLTTNVVGCPPESVHVGMKVRVRFEENGDVFIPLFEPEVKS